jgi:3-deoxy-D-manno-octulosonic-acid transferase
MAETAGAMRLIYNILFPLFFALSAPFYFLKMWRRGDWRRGLGQRFGFYDAGTKSRLAGGRTLWLHAVSVGEVNLCVRLISKLGPALPGWRFVTTTTTSTGMGELQRKLPPEVIKLYYPVDCFFTVRRALAAINPAALVLVEAEIWPNLLWRAQSLGLPLFLVNARVSEKSFGGYRRFGLLFRPLFHAFHGIGAQNEADAARLRELGARTEAVTVTGNLKFDDAPGAGPRALDAAALLEQLGVGPPARVLVAGSTHAGEEMLLAEQCCRLRPRFPDLFPVLVPRHFERAKALAGQLRAAGLNYARRSELTPGMRPVPGTLDGLLVDTTGELRSFYETATLVFVGKSLAARGGQNPIEPGAAGRAMIFGPHMENFRAIAEDFVKSGGAVQVVDAAGLEQTLADLLENKPRRDDLGRRALSVVRRNQGAVSRTASLLQSHLAKHLVDT